MKHWSGQSEGTPGLILRSRIPENLESPLSALDSWLTPNELFYLRNHYTYPDINTESWSLTITGQLVYPLNLSYQQLMAMPKVSIVNTIECSGNKRSLFNPKTPGEQWKIGGISNARWTGVPLVYLLNQVKLKPGVQEIVFGGMDAGPRQDMPGRHPFVRSLPLKDVFARNPLLALYMNDEVLPFKHGFPLRLVTPGWYGMASVKWLQSITAIDTSFQGPFQSIDYVYLPRQNDYAHARPVREIKVNSVITLPSDQAVVYPGMNKITGLAWAGPNTIARVEVSTDGGESWHPTRTTGPKPTPSTWVFWEYHWNETNPGKYLIKVRASDHQGNIQPEKAMWNAKGYGNNGIHSIHVHIPKQVR